MRQPAAQYWSGLLRPGDVVLMLALLLLCIQLASQLWQGGGARSVEVRAAGKLVAELALAQAQHYEVAGPLGITVIEVEAGRARVASDPGPRQYCVRQGWLSQAGAVAICAPNQVSIHLRGNGGGYDSLAY